MLKQKLQIDFKEAFKSGQTERRMTISMALAAVKSRELEKRMKLAKSAAEPSELEAQSQLTDEEIVEVLSSETKKRREAADQYRAGGRPELAEKEEAEIAVINNYLPEQMTEDEVKAQVKATISDLGAVGPKDMGKVIGAVMPKVKGRADGQIVSRLVKEILEIGK